MTKSLIASLIVANLMLGATLFGAESMTTPTTMPVTTPTTMPAGQAADGAKASSMVFKDTKYKFHLELPDTWEIQEGYADKNLDFVMIALSPAENPEATFTENMNILVDTIGKPMKSEDYFEQNLKGVTSDLPNVVISDKQSVTINGMQMYRATYTWTGDTSKITTYQFIFVKDDKGYVITFTSQPGSFEKFRPTFDKIVSSFAFNP